MSLKNWKRELFTIPNLLSLFRLILIPVYVVIYMNAQTEREYFLSAAILSVSCLTDMIDGKIARKFNMISTVGKLLDPIADKATQVTMIVCLAVRYPILRYLFVLFIIKEAFQLIAGIVRLKKGMILKGALITGKVSTTVLFVSLIVMVLLPNLPSLAVNIIAGLDAVFLLVAFADYAYAYFRRDSNFQSIEDSLKHD